MKILILSQFAGSRKHGMVLRNYQWAKTLTEMGHDVTIMASSYAHARYKQPVVDGNVSTEHIDGIRYLWIKGTKSYNPASIIGRLSSMFLFTLKSYIIARRHKREYDIVIASSPQPLVIFAARFLAKKNKAKLIFDIRDLWPLSLMELSKSGQYNPLIWLMQRAEDYACSRVDLITAVPQNCESYLKGRGLAENKFLHVPNGFLNASLQKEGLVQIPNDYRTRLKELKKDNKFLVGYTGSLGEANSMGDLIRSMTRVDDKIHCVLVGKGAKKEDLRTLAIDLKISNRVHIFDPIDGEQIHDFLSYIDVVYAGAKRKKLYEYGASVTKLNDYMFAKKAVLYAVGDPNNTIDLSGCGISCEAENIPEIAEGLDKLFDMSDRQRRKIGELGYRYLLENNLMSVHMARLLQKLSLD
jgi:glycosyltransferase involved in cell wall biosynthesis